MNIATPTPALPRGTTLARPAGEGANRWGNTHRCQIIRCTAPSLAGRSPQRDWNSSRVVRERVGEGVASVTLPPMQFSAVGRPFMADNKKAGHKCPTCTNVPACTANYFPRN